MRFHALLAENARLARELAEGEQRLRELHQRRQDAAKVVDELIARIDELDDRLDTAS